MKNVKVQLLALSLLTFLIGTPSLAADDVPHFINFYSIFTELIGWTEDYSSIIGSLFTLLVCTIVGYSFKKSIEKNGKNLAPSDRVSIRNFIEAGMDFLYNLTKEHCGDRYRAFLPLMCGLFFFILVSNLSGLVPGLPPTTENFNTNLALGLVAFLCYNYAGIKEHGISYIKQFTGPFLVLAPLFLGIELVSHAVRPLSLAFRLLANIFCDHLLLGVFSGLVPLVVPAVFLLFGLLVAFIQSFVFTLLTGIYVNMAISHDH